MNGIGSRLREEIRKMGWQRTLAEDGTTESEAFCDNVTININMFSVFMKITIGSYIVVD